MADAIPILWIDVAAGAVGVANKCLAASDGAAICSSGDSQSVSVAVTVMVLSLLSGLCALCVTPELEW